MTSLDGVEVDECVLGGLADEIHWATPASASGGFVGAIGLKRCTFTRCRFVGIGFAGPSNMFASMQ